MSEGYVYILSNPSMPGLVKIGKTTREPAQRANELYQTGVPEPFVIEKAVRTPNCNELEALMHDNYSQWRVSGSREFFRFDLMPVIESLEGELVLQVNDFVSHYLPDHCVELHDLSVSAESLGTIASAVGEHPIIVADAVREIRPAELRPALDRIAARRAGQSAKTGADQ